MLLPHIIRQSSRNKGGPIGNQTHNRKISKILKIDVTTAETHIFSILFQGFINPFPIMSYILCVQISSQTKQLKSNNSFDIDPTKISWIFVRNRGILAMQELRTTD